jgi:LysM repeat protein
MQAPQKAYLETETGTTINCLLNPASLQLAVSNAWRSDETPGRAAPVLSFAGAGAGSFTTELMFDTTDTGQPVTTHTDKLLKLMKVDASLPGHDPERNRGRPPWVKFHWGDLHSFKAIVESLEVAFIYFASSGAPLRARVNLALRQYEDDSNWGPQNPTSHTPHPHRVHQVQAGETLDRIAARHYGSSSQWRLIADASRVANPLRLEPGTTLVIPRLEGAR